jgi:5-methylcytosine-specific restriction endonuclease McrA
MDNINEIGRVCCSCKKFKNWNDYHNKHTGKNGKQSMCKECTKLNKKQYYIKNKKEILEIRKEYYKVNKKEINKNRKIRNKNNKERNSIKAKEYYKKNKDRIKKNRQQYYKNNKEKILIKDKEYRKINKNKISNIYKNNKDKIILREYAYRQSYAKFSRFVNKLTVLESPRETKGGYLEVKCATCRKYFQPTNIATANRVKSLTSDDGRECRLYCSDACKEACSIFNKSMHPKGFKNPPAREFQKEFRQMILERDENVCQVCGEEFDPKFLQAHHITPAICSPMEQVDIENGICVCKDCHKKLHDQDGCRTTELNKILK